MPVACRRLAGLLLGALFATGAWAQTSELTLYVFNKGAPVPNIEVLLDDELLTLTDDRGVAALSMTPGIHYLELRIEDFVVLDQQILAIEDEISQWIVDISAGGSAFFDVESSGPGETVAPQAEAAVAADLAPGRLSGRLTSADGGEAIAGARVFVSGLGSDIRSDDSGAFTVEVPPGTYSVSILHSGFNTLTRDGVAVEENADVAIDLVLTPA
ncbi:MAG: carboxypeptidase regulatory-like domain-containing protein, partial [Xanthomonadales bacterium]|nr:carboxypeptidase regulatory-like domain-containing protein [Xanthomonadales bacterium]